MPTSVFLSWSGPVSQRFARDFSAWLELTMAPIDVFFSPEIPKGRFWTSQIMERLASCDFGILILTKENLHSEWLHFEAGALSQAVRNGYDRAVAPLLLDVEPYQLPGALSAFQLTRLELEDICRLLGHLRSATGGTQPSDTIIRQRVETHWPDLARAYAEAMALGTSSAEPQSEDSDSAVIRELRTEVGNLRQLTEFLASHLLSRAAEPVVDAQPTRGTGSHPTIYPPELPVASYQFGADEDLTAFRQWLLDEYPGIDFEIDTENQILQIQHYDEVEQLDRLSIRRSAVDNFGGERLE